MSIRLGLLVVWGIVVAGCSYEKDSGQGSRGVEIASIEDIQPAARPPKHATLVLAAMVVPVELATRQSGEFYTVSLLAHDTEIEAERYRASPNAFSLLEAARQVYDPPLPVLKFPLTVGESWLWSGTIRMGAASCPAEAMLTTSEEPLNIEGFGDPALHVSVELRIGGVGPKPAIRSLEFWFVRGKGLLKREFGRASIRLPVAGDGAGR